MFGDELPFSPDEILYRCAQAPEISEGPKAESSGEEDEKECRKHGGLH